jgi:rsbT co-antagonist protein RsbR
VIIDLTGAVSVDPTFCNEIVKLITAIRLLGAQGIVVGIQAETAKHIVATGLDLSQIRTLPTLREALTCCRG